MTPENQDDEIFEEIYREFAENVDELPVAADKKKRSHIKWDMIAVILLIIVLIVLLAFLIINFQKNADKKPDTPPPLATATSEPGSDVSSDDPAGDVSPDSSSSEVTTPVVTEPPSPYPVEADMVVVDGATYINGVLIINKTYSVPESFAPGVDPVAEAKLQEMYAAAAAEGLSMWTASGYRTYQYQQQLYENYAARDGYEAADTYSARPGFSEHESGLAFDVNDPSNTFDDTAEAAWLKEHCAEYGFIIRYPESKEDFTGFMYESWHIRYVGEEIATVIMENDICLEEYFGITSQYADDNDIDVIIDN